MLKKILFIILFCSSWRTTVAQTGKQEANLKAVFIYNFTRYIDWDTSNIENEFVIGIIGSTAVTEPLDEIAKTNTVKNKKIVIRNFSNPDEITPCNILFISANSTFSLSSVLAKINKGTLTITEEAGSAEQGSAFNFVVINDKLKFEANVKSINAAGLKASSQLLKLAIIVN
ncbi:MAG: YfiR family protein [Ginsengibacter sp.]